MDPRVFHAAQNGHMNAIERLYSENPKLLREVTIQKNNVLHIAAREGHSRFVEWILSHVHGSPSMCSARNADYNTVLHEAAKGCDAGAVSMLIELGEASKGCKDKVLSKLFNELLRYIGYPLFFANIFQKTFQALNGPNNWIGLGNKDGRTPLVIACKYGNEDAASHLLEASTPINLLCPIYQTCLHHAALQGHLGIVKLLLNKSNCSNIWRKLLFQVVPYGNPLHASVYGGHIDVVKEILNAPLSSNSRKKLMKQKDKRGRCAIHMAVVKGSYDIVDEFMSLVPDCIELRSSDGKSVLHFAVAYDRFQLVQKLLSDKEHDKVVQLLSYDQDDFGNTAIHLAAQNNVDPQLLKHLLSFSGVNVNAMNYEGLTPRDIAVAASSQNSTNNTIRILEEHGASNKPVFNDINGPISLPGQTEEKESKVMDVDTLVASLVATVTFAAIFQVPGGIQDDKNSLQYGVSRLAFQPYFTVFLVSDMVAFFSSLTVVIGWIFRGRPRKRSEAKSKFMLVTALSLGVSIVCTGIAFVSAVYLVTIPPNLKTLKTTDKEAFVTYRILYLQEYFWWIIIIMIFFSMIFVSGGISKESPVFNILPLIVCIFVGFQSCDIIMELK